MARPRPAPSGNGEGRFESRHGSLPWLIQQLVSDGKTWIKAEWALSRSEVLALFGRYVRGLVLLGLCHALLLVGLLIFLEGAATALGNWLHMPSATHMGLGLLLLGGSLALGGVAWHMMKPSVHLRSAILKWLVEAQPDENNGRD